MAIAPVMYRATGQPGAMLSLPVDVQNLDTHPVEVTLTIHAVTYADWTYGPNLDVKTKFDCSDWFPSKQYVKTIGSTSDYKIPLKCLVPKGLEPGIYYCLGTIEPTVEKGSQDQVHAQYQIPIIIRVGNVPKPNLKFGSPTLEVQDKVSVITMPFTNDGDAFSVIGASVVLRDATGRAVATLNDSDRNLYPQSKRNLTFSILSKVTDGQYSRLPDGRYQVQATCQVNLQTFRPIVAEYVVNKGKASPATPGSVISLPPFTVDPPIFHASMPAGASRIQLIKFTNQTEGPLSVLVSVRGLSQSSNGLFQVLDDAPKGPLTIDASPDTLNIPARSSVSLRVRVSVAPGAVGDSWFAVSAVSAAKDSLSQEVYGSVRVADPKSFDPRLQIDAKGIDKAGDTPVSVDYEVTNTGNIALKPRVTASVMEGGLTAVARLEVPELGDGGILPGATLHNRLQLPPPSNLKPGAYTVRLEYQYATDKDGQPVSEVKQIPFFIPQPKKSSGPPKKPKSGGTS